MLNGLFQEDLSPTSSQLTRISDAFLVPITLLGPNFGAPVGVSGRMRPLVGGPVMIAAGEVIGGFALAISTVTAVAVDTVPNHLTGMASGTTNMLRDFGFTLGPAVIQPGWPRDSDSGSPNRGYSSSRWNRVTAQIRGPARPSTNRPPGSAARPRSPM